MPRKKNLFCFPRFVFHQGNLEEEIEKAKEKKKEKKERKKRKEKSGKKRLNGKRKLFNGKVLTAF